MFSDESIENLRESIRAGRPLTGPTDVQIMPTPRCNATCGFCPLHAIPGPLMKHAPRFQMYKSDLSGGLLDRLADDLYYLGGLKRMTITGGEPLLYPFLVPMVFQFGRSIKGAELTVVTNGIKLKNFGAFFVHAGLHNLHVSINAGTEKSYCSQNPGAKHGLFDEILAGVETVTKERRRIEADRPHVTLSAVLTRASAGDVEALFEIGRRTGVDAVTFIPLMEIRLEGESINRGRRVTEDQLKNFHEDMEEFSGRAGAEGFFMGYAGSRGDRGVMDSGDLYGRQPCYSGYTFAAIYPNGDVRPCCHCEPVMGNLCERSFIDIWNSVEYQEQRERMMRIHEGGGSLPGCFCGECGYSYENREFHKKIE
jgi:MoaA/NifB/PqqE/SkfB family radical SAM enzyme